MIVKELNEVSKPTVITVKLNINTNYHFIYDLINTHSSNEMYN